MSCHVCHVTCRVMLHFMTCYMPYDISCMYVHDIYDTYTYTCLKKKIVQKDFLLLHWYVMVVMSHDMHPSNNMSFLSYYVTCRIYILCNIYDMSVVSTSYNIQHVTWHLMWHDMTCEMSNDYIDPWDMLNNFCFHVYTQMWHRWKVKCQMSSVKCQGSNVKCQMLMLIFGTCWTTHWL